MKNHTSADKSFNSLSQTKPEFSNIYDYHTDEKQLGVFYSYTSEEKYITIDDTTINFLDTSSIYQHLGF